MAGRLRQQTRMIAVDVVLRVLVGARLYRGLGGRWLPDSALQDYSCLKISA